MGQLSADLYEMGFTPVGRESPVSEDGELWSNGYEVVCDETGTIIDGEEQQNNDDSSKEVYRYRNSERVKMIGGFLGTYDWGHDDGQFRY